MLLNTWLELSCDVEGGKKEDRLVRENVLRPHRGSLRRRKIKKYI